ncbi:MAG TPA: type IV pilus modification protein PilV [Sedimenticola sp.]|nr:type IV pilus modification protein PilV [Sedimenticola sp.]
MKDDRISPRPVTGAPPLRRSRGFTLIEVLITVVIMSIGLLGLAGLQFNSLRSNQSAAQATMAAVQALDAADRLRGNPAGAAAGNYNLLAGESGDPGCIGTSAGCSPAQLARYDDWAWSRAVAGALPSGEGVICLDSTPDDGVSRAEHECDGARTGGLNVFVAKIWWDDDRNPATPPRRHYLSLMP